MAFGFTLGTRLVVPGFEAGILGLRPGGRRLRRRGWP
jgi:FKBP-type peptidyl-prolyl cis-trans isomerase (trigger factor)